MARVATQMVVVTGLRDDHSIGEIFETVHEAGFDGVELAFLDFAFPVGETDMDEARATLRETGLEAVSAHVPLSQLRDDPADVVELYRSFECDSLVVPYLDRSHFDSRAAVADTAETLTAVADAFGDEGFSLQYHNHDQEFVEVEGRYGLERLIERTDDRVGIQFDVGTAVKAGADPVAFVEEYGDRITSLHVKDDVPGREDPAPLGEGATPVRESLRAATDHGIEWMIYEGDVEADTLEGAVSYIRDGLRERPDA